MRTRLITLLLCCCTLLPLPVQAALDTHISAAREAARSGDLKKLLPIIEKTDGTVLEIYPRFWLLQAQINQLPDAEIHRFLERYPSSYLGDRLRADWLRALARRGDWTTFETEWPQLVNWEPGSDLHCYRLQLAVQRSDTTTLREARPFWFSEKRAPEACETLFDTLLERAVLSQADVWARLRLALQAGNTDFAVSLIDRLSNPEGLSAKLIREVAAKPQQALSRLNLGSRGGRELALFVIGRAGRADPDQGKALLDDAGKKLPEADRRYALMRLAYHAGRRNRPEALAWFKRATQTGLTQEEADWRIRSALRAQDWNAVAEFIDALSPERQKEPVWNYWRGRAHAAAGDPVQANQHFSSLADLHQFYGLLAREELGAVLDTPQVRFKPGPENLQEIRQMPGVARALALFGMDWRLEGLREWNWAMRGLTDRQLLAAAEVARLANWYDRAIYSADRTKELHDFSLRYLSPYRDVTRTYARQLELDDAWVYGLIRQESRFVIAAKSTVGASGLMQLMPATAKWVARKIGIPLERTGVNEIGTNVQLGTYYLKHVLESLGNQPVLATAAYNAGPGRARAWQDARALEGAIYAETIPFNETRDYVKKVMANAVFYAQAFGRGETSIKQRLGTIPGRNGTETPLGDTP